MTTKHCVMAYTAALSAGLLAMANPSGFTMTRSTIDGGGTVLSSGGGFELSGTIGQPDAGVSSGGGFQLTGGFWFETPFGDCNSDALTDLVEFGGFDACSTGPNQPFDPGCACFDANADNDVDLQDFGRFQASFDGQ